LPKETRVIREQQIAQRCSITFSQAKRPHTTTRPRPAPAHRPRTVVFDSIG
jgi:hypothetical protein